MARVWIPDRAKLDVSFSSYRPSGPTPDVRIRGGGRFAGIVIINDDLPERSVSGEFLLAGRWRACRADRCGRESIVNVLETPSGRRQGSISLARGWYRLYLIADDSEVEITLNLAGLDGHTYVEPRQSARVDIKTPEVRVELEPDGSHIFSAGSTYDGSGLGFGLAIWSLYDRTPQPIQLSECLYTYDPPPEEAAYGPHCSTLADAGSTTTMHPRHGRTTRFALVNLWTIPHDGDPVRSVSTTRGYGLWFHSDGHVESLINHALMFSFD